MKYYYTEIVALLRYCLNYESYIVSIIIIFTWANQLKVVPTLSKLKRWRKYMVKNLILGGWAEVIINIGTYILCEVVNNVTII